MSAKRGKFAETKIKAALEDWKQKVAAFTYNRILDARSSLGAMSNPQPGDFQWFRDYDVAVTHEGKHFGFTRNGLIESKEVEHTYRLPYMNFSPDQVGRMVIRQMAGSECIIIVCHRVPDKRGASWRNVPLDFFRERPGTKYGSWDLSEFPIVTNVEDILIPYLS